jgi:hypothetical protein
MLLGGCIAAAVLGGYVASFALMGIADTPWPTSYEREMEKKREPEKAIYSHMKRYGINREDVAKLQSLYEKWHGKKPQYKLINTADILRPGEYYRIEMDEFVLTMKVPGAQYHGNGKWIYPYVDTRQTTDSEQDQLVAHISWRIDIPSFSKNMPWWGVKATYYILPQQRQEEYLNPEAIRKIRSDAQNVLIEKYMIYDSIALTPEIVTINERIWIHEAMDKGHVRTYRYITTLSPDRGLLILFIIPNDRDISSGARKAYGWMQEMVASIRITKINDDGSPDPFVVERVEPAPLPVREKRPASQ